MAYIRVDHSKLDSAASEIENYVESMKQKMNGAQNEVNALSTNWQGDDYNQFLIKWGHIVDSNSTYEKMIKSLEAYAKFLRFAAGKYRDAQANAVNRANGLPRF